MLVEEFKKTTSVDHKAKATFLADPTYHIIIIQSICNGTEAFGQVVKTPRVEQAFFSIRRYYVGVR